MDSLAAVFYAQRDYLALCEHYGEPPIYKDDGRLDCFGAHARELERREIADSKGGGHEHA